MKKLNPSQQEIIDLLIDFKVHCTAHEMYRKDDRTRISELRKMGFVFNEKAGNCKDLKHGHNADLKLRQLISVPDEYLSGGRSDILYPLSNGTKPKPEQVAEQQTPLSKVPERVRIWQAQFITKEKVKERGLW